MANPYIKRFDWGGAVDSEEDDSWWSPTASDSAYTPGEDARDFTPPYTPGEDAGEFIPPYTPGEDAGDFVPPYTPGEDAGDFTPPYTPGEDAKEFPGGGGTQTKPKTGGGLLDGLPKGAQDFFKSIVADSSGKPNPMGIMALATLLSTLTKGSGTPPPTGYTGGIPSYSAVRQRVQYEADPNRRPGAGARQYFTPMQYVKPTEVDAARAQAARQAQEMAAAAPKYSAPTQALPARQEQGRAVEQKPAESDSSGGVARPAVERYARDPKTGQLYDFFTGEPINPSLPKVELPYYMQELMVDERGRAIQYPSPSGYREATNTPPPRKNVLEGLGRLFSKENAPPRFTMEDVKAANPGLDWSKYQQPSVGSARPMIYTDFDRARDTYARTGRGLSDQPVAAAQGGLMNLAKGRYLSGSTDGMADKIPANIEGKQPARLSHGEFVVPADVVSHLGNGNSEAGAERLYSMMDRIRKARTGTTKQGKQINPDKYTPV